MRNKTLDIAKGIAMISIILGAFICLADKLCCFYISHSNLLSDYRLFPFWCRKNQLPEVCGKKSQNPFGPILCGLFVDHNVFNSTQYVFGRGCEDTGNKVD